MAVVVASQPASWTHIKSNLFLHRSRKTQTIDEVCSDLFFFKWTCVLLFFFYIFLFHLVVLVWTYQIRLSAMQNAKKGWFLSKSFGTCNN